MRRFVQRVGIVLVAWFVAAIGAEFAFRASGDLPSFDLHGLYAPFIDGTYRLAPNINTDANWSSGRLTVHTDMLALRCDEDRKLAVKIDDTIDVLLLGDSQGFGNGVSFDESLSGSLALAAASEGYRVANAAVGGHSAATQLLLARWLRKNQGLKVANYVLLATPAIIQSGGHLSRARVGGDGRLYGTSADRLTQARTWAKTNLVTYARIRDAVRNSGIVGEPSKEEPFVFKFYESGASALLLRASFSEYIAQFKKFASEEGAQLHIVYVPLTLEVEFEPIKAAAMARGLAIDSDTPFQVCEAVAREHQISFHDLRPVLKSLHQHSHPLHLQGDFHYNRELSVASGHDIWAELKPRLSRTTSVNPKTQSPSHGD